MSDYFHSKRRGFLTAGYALDYHGPVFRGKHPLPWNDQAIGRDTCLPLVEAGEEFSVVVASDEAAEAYASRNNAIPYSYFVRHRGLAFAAFFTYEQAKAWTDAYGLTSLPNPGVTGIEVVTVRKVSAPLPLRVDLSKGRESPDKFALLLLERENTKRLASTGPK